MAASVTVSDLVRELTLAPRFWRFLRHRMSLEEASQQMERRLAAREDNFLRSMDRMIYANPRSPYLRLLDWADCDYADVQRMVRSQGLEPTLEALHKAGVYVTFDEFKGRVPIVRHGRTLAVRPGDFDNPVTQPYFYGRTGGSTGASVRIPLSWEHHLEQSVNLMLHDHAHGLLDTKLAYWLSTPEVVLSATMDSLPYRRVAEKWFAPMTKRLPWTRRAFFQYFVAAGRVARIPIPRPESVDLDEADVVARWAAATRDRHGTAMVYGFVSQMLRVALAASDIGLDLTGVTLSGGGEPPTPAKVGAITRTGARWVPSYYADKVAIGLGCVRPLDGNDLHFSKDRLALIQRPQQVPGSSLVVDAFCFSSLSATAPKILLNAETDDYGVVESRSCGCPLEDRGLVEHLREVRSYRKLTGEGITLVGGDLERIVEEVLPARFGGSPLDYQFVEEEDGQGLTRLHMVIDPRVEISNEQAVVETVLRSLEETDSLGASTASVWEQAGTVQVRRQAPVRTAAGKLMPLHVAR